MRHFFCYVFFFAIIALSVHMSPRAQSPATTYAEAFENGQEAVSAGKYQQAIFHFTQALKFDARSTDALLARAEAYYQRGLANSALADCAKVIQIQPRLGQAWKIRGAVLTKQKRFVEAIQEFKKAEELHYPFDSSDCYVYGIANLNAENLPAAAECFKNTVRLNERRVALMVVSYRNPDEVYQAFNQLGMLSNKQKNQTEANYYFAQAIKLQPKNYLSYQLRGEMFFQSQQYQAAADDYAQVVLFAPKLAEAWQQLGVAQHLLGYHDDALKCSREALRLNPQRNQIRFTIGLILAWMGHAEQSKLAYTEALKAATKEQIHSAMQALRFDLQRQPHSQTIPVMLQLLAQTAATQP